MSATVRLVWGRPTTLWGTMSKAIIHRAGAGVIAALLVAGGAGCGKTETPAPTQSQSSSAGSSPDSTAGTTATPKTEASRNDKGAGEYEKALKTLGKEYGDAADTRDEAADDNDLKGGIAASADMRTAVYDFDKEVRDITFSDEVTPKVNDLLTENGKLIAALDAFVEITKVADYNKALNAQIEASASWQLVADDLAEALGIKPVSISIKEEPTTKGTSTTTKRTTTSLKSTPAGEKFKMNVLTVTVPKGFEGVGSILKGPDGTMISSGSITGERYAGMPLAEVAKTYSSGVADKGGYTIAAGPRELTVAGDPAIGYEMNDKDGEVLVEVIFEHQGKFYAVSLDGPAAAVDANASLFGEMLQTLTVN